METDFYTNNYRLWKHLPLFSKYDQQQFKELFLIKYISNNLLGKYGWLQDKTNCLSSVQKYFQKMKGWNCKVCMSQKNKTS